MVWCEVKIALKTTDQMLVISVFDTLSLCDSKYEFGILLYKHCFSFLLYKTFIFILTFKNTEKSVYSASSTSIWLLVSVKMISEYEQVHK